MASKGPKPGNPVKPTAKVAPAADVPVAPPVLAQAEPVKIEAPKVAPAPEKKAAALKTAVAKPVAPKPVAPKPVTAPVAKVAPKPVEPASVALATPPAPKPAPVVAPPPAPVAAAPILPEPTTQTPPAPPQKEKTIMATTFETTTDKTQAFFGEANDRAKAAFEKSTKLFEEMNEFGKGNLEAVVESGKIAAKGLETLGQDAAEYTRKQFEGATAIAKSFASVKSPTELFKLQSDFFKTSFDALVAESSKTTEAMLKLAGEVAQPISNRVALAAEKVKLAA